jgi:hypothetical protein
MLLLPACTLYQAIQQHREQQTRMASALAGYVGKSVADLALDRGPPTNAIDLGANKRSFEWEVVTEAPEVAVPAPGSRIGATAAGIEQTCLVSVVAWATKESPSLSDWIIESSKWKGGSC